VGFVSQAATACWRVHSSPNWNWVNPNPNREMYVPATVAPQERSAVSSDQSPSPSNRYSMKQGMTSPVAVLAAVAGVFGPREESGLYRSLTAR